jgi:hypothetical protein
MSIPPVQTSAFGPGARLKPAARRNRTAERLAITGAAVLAVLILALWQVPPMLDWSRYKGALAAYAGARLGRHVTIDGHIGLSLLPRAMLTADRVTLADRGDGISAKLGTMRLEVSLRGLFAGHVVPRTLSLDNPVASLPWPMPRGAAPHIRPGAATEFSATLMGGTLHLGGVTFHDIAAGLHTDPASGAFGAQGSAMVAGLPWRFTALVGAPGADGAAPLTLTLDGQAPYGKGAAIPGLLGTGGAFDGRILADGTVIGRLVLRGPDLSVLGPAPALPWQAQGQVRGDGITLSAPALSLTLGPSSGTAAATLGLGATPTLTLRLALGTIALGDWAWQVLTDAPAMASHLPADFDISAGTATWHGDTIQAPHAVLALATGGLAIKTVTAGLPGGASLDFAGAIQPGGHPAGGFHLHAPDARRTLHWLTQGGSDALPPTILRQADLSGTLSLAPGRAALTGLAGRIDGSAIAGAMRLGSGAPRAIDLDMETDTLDLAAWLPGFWTTVWRPGSAPFHFPALSALASPFTQGDLRLRLRAGHLAIPGLTMDHAALDAEGGPAGLTLHSSSANAAGGRLSLSGSVAADGTLAAGRAEYTSDDAARLPDSWRVPATLWHGPLHVLLTASGPTTDTAAQLRADLGDLRAEAEAHIDQTTPTATATITLRHPGAPRLLAEAGWPGTEAWLEHGSLALLTHVVATPDHVQVKDFSLAAAAFHAGGALDADFSQTPPVVTGDIDAAVLAVPALPADGAQALPWAALRDIQADLHIRSAHVLSGLRPVLANVTAHLLAGGGVAALQDVTGTMSGGDVTAQVAADTTQAPPLLSATMHVQHAFLPTPDDGAPPVPDWLYAGSLDAEANLTAQGATPRALAASAAGPVTASFQGVTLTGIDLPSLATALATQHIGWRASVAAALRGGESPGLDGAMTAAIHDGAWAIGRFTLAGPAGAIEASGSADLRSGQADFRAAIRKSAAEPPIHVTVTGVWPGWENTADLPVQRHAGRPRRRK